MPKHIEIPCDELGASYLGGMSTPALGLYYGCSAATIAKRLRGCGVALRSARFISITIPEAALRRLYLEERRPIAEIAAFFGVSTSTVGNKRRAHGIPSRAHIRRLEIGE